ncbi:MAG: hypothetical protein ABIS07_09615 [Dokdonella sp.]
MISFRTTAIATLLSAATPGIALACSSCGCTLNADWATQGLSAGRGWRFDVREDYFNQSQLRSGTDSVGRGSIELPSEQEVQQTTVNRNTTFGIEYNPNANWGISATLPYFDRFHTTIGEGDNDISTSHSHGIGDLRVIARYAGLSADRTTGIQFGLKLPTGRTDDTFSSGPLEGEIVDRGLQPGTGSTDLLVGAYHFGMLAQNWDYFAQGLLQQPISSKDDFKPGTGVNFSLGTRYVANTFFVPQLQVNVRAEKRESGANADIPNSGATLAYLSPGFTLNFNRRFAGFLFVQAPIYQRVNGLQLEPRYSVSAGLHYIF